MPYSGFFLESVGSHFHASVAELMSRIILPLHPVSAQNGSVVRLLVVSSCFCAEMSGKLKVNNLIKSIISPQPWPANLTLQAGSYGVNRSLTYLGDRPTQALKVISKT